MIPLGTSYTPGRTTSPESENSRLPLQPPLPPSAYHWPPWIMIAGAQANVSTLLTSVGRS